MNQAEYTIRTTEELLASSPADRDVYKTYIASQKPEKEDATDELDTLPEREITGWSVFHTDDKGLFLFDYHIRGFLKEAARNITGTKGDTGITALVSKIDRFVFVSPRRLYLKRNGKIIAKPDGLTERPLKAMTMQGPRVSLKRSDKLLPGVELTFTITILPLGEKEIKQEHIAKWLEYGQYCGLGEWRNASHGRFELVTSNGTGESGEKRRAAKAK